LFEIAIAVVEGDESLASSAVCDLLVTVIPPVVHSSALICFTTEKSLQFSGDRLNFNLDLKSVY
jgi:hypothetical protein